MLFYLIYVSKATAPMSDAELLSLLDTSRIWNQTHDLTGMLLYIQGGKAQSKPGRFIQVLEGNEQDVAELFAKITNDPRHHHITLLNQGPIKARNFEDWRMGFESIPLDDIKKHDGFVELNSAFLESLSPKKFNFALTFLKSFYDMRSQIS